MKLSANVLLTRLGVALLAGSVVQSSAGEDLVVPAYSFVSNHVESGTSVVQSERMIASPEGRLSKTGGGEWVVPYEALPRSGAVSVDEGKLSVVSSGKGPSVCNLPDSLTAKALIWVDASDPVSSHIVREGDAVSVWYDRREGESVEIPCYCRAKSYAKYTNQLPTFVRLGGETNAVYFGGYKSGQAMEFVLPSGSSFNEYSYKTSVGHVFAVHAIEDSYGTLFGSFSSRQTPFRKDTTHADEWSNYYWESATTWPAMSNGRTYLNGERIDGTLTKIHKGLQLLEAERFFHYSTVVQGLFAGNKVETAGGDYICEALVFTNRLTESERVLVTEYLMAKWLPNESGGGVDIEIKDGASVSLDAAKGDVDFNAVGFTGDGAIEVSGNGGILVGNDRSKVFDGTLSLDGGLVTLRSPMAIALSSSGLVTVTNKVTGPEVMVNPDSSGVIVKDGNDDLIMRTLPQSLKKVSVKEGLLSVLPSVPNNMQDRYLQIPIEDGGFEGFIEDIDKLEEGQGVLTAAKMDESAKGGWTYTWNGAATCHIMNWWRWTGRGTPENTTRSEWNYATPPPEGSCALFLRAGGSADKDAIALSKKTYDLESGLYELRCFICGRQSETYLGQIFSPRLIDGATKELKAKFGDVMYTDMNGYKEIRLRTTLSESGNYRFEFRSLGGRLGAILVDDVRLFKVTPSFATASKWKIPGGDFETDTIPLGSGIKRFTPDYMHANWNFIQSEKWVEGNLADVGISTVCSTNATADHGKGVYFNDSRRPATGSMELCFRNGNCSAVTVFTPPAGRWQLQGDVAQFGSYGTNPKVSARVKVGDVVHELGMISAKTRLMRRFAWPVSFHVDGTQEVELTLTSSGIGNYYNASSHGLLVDDLVLAGATDVEMMKCGDTEGLGLNLGYSLQSDSASVFGGVAGICRSRSALSAPEAFGTTVIKGEKMITIENLSALFEDVYVPFPGRYRFSFYVHSRLNNKSNYGPNRLRAWIAADGVTNVVGYADTYNSEWVQRVFDFNVPSAGVWRVALQGCDNPDDEKIIHEAHVDALSLRQIPDISGGLPPFSENCRVSVAEGARLEVGFEGTNTVRELKLGGVEIKGVVDVADYPEYLSGQGVFNVVPWGTVISVR